MSWVTVKTPYAPEPLACILRSGITSRSKCASFSRNQTSCSSIGPPGPPGATKPFLPTAGGRVRGAFPTTPPPPPPPPAPARGFFFFFGSGGGGPPVLGKKKFRSPRGRGGP